MVSILISATLYLTFPLGDLFWFCFCFFHSVILIDPPVGLPSPLVNLVFPQWISLSLSGFPLSLSGFLPSHIKLLNYLPCPISGFPCPIVDLPVP